MISQRANRIKSFMAMDVMERAMALEKKGQEIIHLEIGEPDFETPLCIKEAAQKALVEGKTGYTHSLGIIELREAIAEFYLEKYGVSISPEQILITSGTSQAMLMVYGALVSAGDEVIMSNPHYPCYPNFVQYYEGIPKYINVYEEDGFQYRLEDVKTCIGEKTKAMVINSPSNPTGHVLSAELIESLAELPLLLISDEIYHGLVYEGKEHSVLEYTGKSFVFNGFSKLYAMTGWRLGYLIAPREYIRTLQVMHQNFMISANAFVQWAGLAALQYAQADVAAMVLEYNRRRRFMLKRLKEIGFGVRKEPVGAFYILANARSFTSNSYNFAFELLENAGVAVTPGIDFGSNAEGYLRFTYANSLERIAKAMDRLEVYLNERSKGRCSDLER
ncbi:MAG: pyridoxal phosphate-dependent aminotransferase [Candidatus Tectomicrobia bacterium]|uniref:Aminotransferase n=1 Tax=Tectimicrobiota bacterium TaxID=2528274 RepID=A0A933GMT1_UNCTE|nr:pyridoxal phosphate-dependent aminotransferase [Candidatus Tectomicrobia bacterium]